MQTPKASKSNSSEAPLKISPCAVRQLKTSTIETNRSPKVLARGSPKSPASEKKRPSKIFELESQISQLQEELKNTKEKLISSESWKIQAEKNEKELNQKLLESSLELNETQKKLSDLSLHEESHKTNHEKISRDGDEPLERADSIEIEIKSLRENLNETLSLDQELENAKKTIETLQLKSINMEKALDFVNLELYESRAKLTFLEGVVESEKIAEFRNELAVLKSALEHEKIKYNEERINSILMIDSLNETAEFTRASFGVREAELEASLSKAKADADELKALLMDKENEIRAFPEREITVLKEEIEILKCNLMDKETESQNIAEENETLKMEMKRHEVAKAEEERQREERVRVAERLAAVEEANAVMEAELMRLKVQADQWRKAAEVAAAVVASCHDGKFVERTGSLDSRCIGKLGSPYRGDIDDEIKKKNGNLLKKIGVLWKKPQK